MNSNILLLWFCFAALLVCLALGENKNDDDDDDFDPSRPIVNENGQGKILMSFKKALRSKCGILVDLTECLRLGNNRQFYYPCDERQYITCSSGYVFHIMNCAYSLVFNTERSFCGK